MSTEAQNILTSFEAIPLPERKELLTELLRRAADWEESPLSDDQLAQNADDLFQALDNREAADAEH